MIGETVGHYRIIEKIGEGGMGVVYRAEDTKLKRTIALKFLPPDSTRSAEARERFIHEAQAASALDHPNICTVHEIDETDEGQVYIVMGLYEGETLREKIAERPLKLEDAIDITSQIAQGLAKAHEQKIIHRDIKPANIFITNEGQVKILDFGVAKLAGATKLTLTGTTLGTVSYMAPEQAKGDEADHKADIWSLGVLMYEMLTGQQPFKGEHEQAVIYSILNEEPESITALRTGIPIDLEWIVQKALKKDSKKRYQHIDEIPVDLEAVEERRISASRVSVIALPSAAVAAPVRISRSIPLGISVLITILISIVVGTAIWFLRPVPENPLRKYQWLVDGLGSMAISPDGTKIAYIQNERLWIRDLSQVEPREVPDSEEAVRVFWSPESDFVAYVSNRTSTGGRALEPFLKKVPAEGGASIELCSLPGLQWGTWSANGTIFLTQSIRETRRGSREIYKVSELGGEPIVFIEVGSSQAAIDGSAGLTVLPDGRSLVFSIRKPDGSWSLVVQSGNNQKSLIDVPPGERVVHPVFSTSGHLLYERYSTSDYRRSVWALPFNPSRLKETGDPFLVAQEGRGASVSTDGILAYRITRPGLEQLVWVDRNGQITGNIGQPQDLISSPALSPDGRLVAVAGEEGGTQDIWLHDVERQIKTRLSYDLPSTWGPSWSPSGDRIVFQSRNPVDWWTSDIYLQIVAGSSPPEPLIQTSQDEYGPHWSPDGEFILYTSVKPDGDGDIWYLSMSDTIEPQLLLQTPFYEFMPFLSPDGQYMAYMSNRTGRYEIYVTPFPECDRHWPVSVDGGSFPQWYGNEIFFVDREQNTLMAAQVQTSPEFQAGSPQPLFSGDQNNLVLAPPAAFSYTATPGGQRFVAVQGLGEESIPIITVVENWYRQFKN